MDSSTLVLVAGVFLLTFFLLVILYLLYKYLISETPYQRTGLIDALESKSNEKKPSKKSKSSGVRQRNVAKGGEDVRKNGEDGKVEKLEVEKTTKKKAEKEKAKKETEEMEDVIDKMAPLKTPKIVLTEGDSEGKKTAPIKSLLSHRKGEGVEVDGGKVEKKKKDSVSERKEVVEEVMEAKKVIGLENQAEKTAFKLQQQQQQHQEMLKHEQQQSPIQHQHVKQIVQQQQQQINTQQQKQPQIIQQQQLQQQGATKKKGKRQNDTDNELVAGLIQQQEQQQKQQQLKQQQQQQQSKQQQLKQQQQQLYEDPSMVEDLKRMVASKETLLQREIQQKSNLNETLRQMRDELEKEKVRGAMEMKKKQSEEHQAMLTRMHQSEQQSHQQMTIQKLKEELTNLKNNTKSTNIIMSNLAEENAKIKAKYGHTDKVNEDRTKTIDVLKASLQNAQYALTHTQTENKNIKSKAQQAANFNLALESKQKEASEKIEKLEGSCYELRHEQEQQQQQFQQRLQQLQQQLSQQHQRSISDMENKLKLVEEENTQLHTTIKNAATKNLTHTSSSPIKISSMTNGCDKTTGEGVVDDSKWVELEKEKEDLMVKLQVKEKKNEDLRQKNWKVMEVLTERERRLEMMEVEKADLIKHHEKQLQQLQTQTTTTNHTTTKTGENTIPRQASDPEIDNVKELKLVAKANDFCMKSQEDEIVRLQQLLQQQTNKNDDLRKKNWAIMTSLTEYEGKVESLTHQLTTASSSSSATKSEVTVVKKVNESCEWDMGEIAGVLEKKEAEMVIMQALLDQNEQAYQSLKEENDELKNKQPITTTNNKHNNGDDEDEMTMLMKEVELYKKVLTDTESTLQRLESSIDVREDGWKRQNDALKEKLQQFTNQS